MATATAKYVTEITVTDPDSNLPVEMAIFKHANGGMFGVDSSYLDQCFDDDVAPMIPDPLEFNNERDTFHQVELTGL